MSHIESELITFAVSSDGDFLESGLGAYGKSRSDVDTEKTKITFSLNNTLIYILSRYY